MSIKQGTVKISELQSVKGKFSLAGKKAIVTGGARGFFLAVLVTCLSFSGFSLSFSAEGVIVKGGCACILSILLSANTA